MTYKEKLFYYLKNIYFKRINSILILFYHRFTNLGLDPRNLCVIPSKFEDEIQYLKNNFNIISSSDLISSFKKGIFPRRSIIITFDDGYSDNYYIASRILKKHNVPATFFITAGIINSTREFWWDEIEKIFLIDFDNFKPLEIFINNNRYFWDIKDKQDIKKLYNELMDLLRFINSNERSRILKELFNWSNKKKTMRDSHKILTEKELQELVKNNLFDIGSHTVNHCSLASLSPQEQFYEMSESKKILETIVENEVIGIAYPYGNIININKDTKTIANKVGYKFGMAVINSIVFKKSDLFLLPRHPISSMNINDFKEKIELIINPIDITDKIKKVFSSKTYQNSNITP